MFLWDDEGDGVPIETADGIGVLLLAGAVVAAMVAAAAAAAAVVDGVCTCVLTAEEVEGENVVELNANVVGNSEVNDAVECSAAVDVRSGVYVLLETGCVSMTDVPVAAAAAATEAISCWLANRCIGDGVITRW